MIYFENIFRLEELLNSTTSLERKIEKVTCSHTSVIHYYIESIEDKNAFQAKHCINESLFILTRATFGKGKQGDALCSKSDNQMGYFTKREPGVYYVKTESSPHFHVSNFHKTWSPSNNVNNSYFPGYCSCNFFSVILKAYSKSFKMFKVSFFTKIFTALSHKPL